MQRDFSVSMTPMIDVVFLLLIFFVCTASFQIAESLLPSPLSLSGATAELPPEMSDIDLERVLIDLAEHDNRLQIAVNGRLCASPTEFSRLLEALSNIDATLPVLLDIADDIRLSAVIDVYDRCRLAGFQRIQFVAEVTR